MQNTMLKPKITFSQLLLTHIHTCPAFIFIIQLSFSQRPADKEHSFIILCDRERHILLHPHIHIHAVTHNTPRTKHAQNTILLHPTQTSTNMEKYLSLYLLSI
uniref:Uncharacterized protein n=1 Tax=Octopus bimaculoides TaxID=37653 RepID=A0A0L8GMV0_OCTBM